MAISIHFLTREREKERIMYHIGIFSCTIELTTLHIDIKSNAEVSAEDQYRGSKTDYIKMHI